MAKHFKKFRGLTDKQLLNILVKHEEAINQHAEAVNRQAEALRWLLRTAGHPAFQTTQPVVDAEFTGVDTEAGTAVEDPTVSSVTVGADVLVYDEVGPVPEAVWADLGRPEETKPTENNLPGRWTNPTAEN